MMTKIEFILFVVQLYTNLVEKSIRINALDQSLAKYRAISVYLQAYMKNCMVQQILILKEHERICKLDHTSTFWEVDCLNNGDEFFSSNFRMKKTSFLKLCELLKNVKEKETRFRTTISLEKRIAIALYALGSSAEYRTIGNIFGVGKSTVCTIVLEFCQEVWKQLFPLYLNHFPLSRETITECVHGFQQIGFPQCLGALDGCHIEIRPKKNDACDYINYKGWYSTILLALVDSKYRFLYINVGSPGRCNDSTIYEKSLLKAELQRCELLDDMSIAINSVNVPIMILGDSAFRFSKKLMKPYAFSIDNTAAQRTFNYRLSKCRLVVENAFGHLKARFRRIGKGLDNHVENTNAVIKACCVLHNFLISEKDDVPRTWLNEQAIIDETRPTPNFTSCSTNNEAENIRRALSAYFDGSSTSGHDSNVQDGLGDDNVQDGPGDSNVQDESGDIMNSLFG